MVSASIFIDIIKWITDINQSFSDFYKWIIDINKYGRRYHNYWYL